MCGEGREGDGEREREGGGRKWEKEGEREGTRTKCWYNDFLLLHCVDVVCVMESQRDSWQLLAASDVETNTPTCTCLCVRYRLRYVSSVRKMLSLVCVSCRKLCYKERSSNFGVMSDVCACTLENVQFTHSTFSTAKLMYMYMYIHI